MDSDRKYRQHGYSESSSYSNGQKSGNGSNGHGSFGNGNGEKPRPSGPRPPIDITGPRLPRLVQAVTASRCYSCSTTLPPGTEFTGNCPKCGAALHCCKQCVHFESSTRFQCLKPIPVRIAVKDQANECTLFSPRVTVAREATSQNSGQGNNGGFRSGAPNPNAPPPRNASDARDAFDRLFRKT
jgi:hypothetical protein